ASIHDRNFYPCRNYLAIRPSRKGKRDLGLALACFLWDLHGAIKAAVALGTLLERELALDRLRSRFLAGELDFFDRAGLRLPARRVNHHKCTLPLSQARRADDDAHFSCFTARQLPIAEGIAFHDREGEWPIEMKNGRILRPLSQRNGLFHSLGIDVWPCRTGTGQDVPCAVGVLIDPRYQVALGFPVSFRDLPEFKE